jgi:ABC-2 type transport system permease protein
MNAIYKRELRAYFNSMIGYVYTSIVLILIGVMFIGVNLFGGNPYFAAALSGALIILVLAVPILTMKSMAEERHQKTDQLLLTYPVKISSVILGKYFAMLTVYALPLLISCLCPLIISWVGSGSFLLDYSAIFAFLCLGAMLVAIGMFISSLTENQIIAAVVTMGAFILLLIWPWLTSLVPHTASASLAGFMAILVVFLLILYALTRSSLLATVLGIAVGGGLIAVYLIKSTLLAGSLNAFLEATSISKVVGNFVGNFVFDLKGILFLLSFAALFVFLTIQSVQKRRWS